MEITTLRYTPFNEVKNSNNVVESHNFKLAQSFQGCSNTSQKSVSEPFDRLVVLGDSLSDSEGRMSSKSHGLVPLGHQYYDGRFTNGFTWPEFLCSPNLINKRLLNQAEGGAVSASYSKINPAFFFVSNMTQQTSAVDFSEKDLVIVEFGANDYMTFHKKDVDRVIEAQEKNIHKIIDQGVKNLIVMGMPDLSVTAKIKHKRAQKQEDLHQISVLHNEKLRALVDKIAENKDVNIHFFDSNACMTEIFRKADELEYDTHDRFPGNKTPEPETEVNTSHHYVFNDDVHPSQEVHLIIAMRLEEFIHKNFSTQPQ